MSRRKVEIGSNLVNGYVKTFHEKDISNIFIDCFLSWQVHKPVKEATTLDDPCEIVLVDTQVYRSQQRVYRIEVSVWFAVIVEKEISNKAV